MTGLVRLALFKFLRGKDGCFLPNNATRRMSRAPIHICFYSNRCKWCEAFITELKGTPYLSEFKFVCVDPAPNRPSLPSWLKKVPTLVISEEPEPRTDAEVMNWLYERKLKDGGSRGGGGGGAVGPTEPEPFGLMGSSGGDLFNDPYTFLDQDTSAQGNGGLRGGERGFSFLNGGGAMGTREGSSMGGAASIGSVSKVSQKERLFDQQMQAYMNSRDSGMPQGPKRI
jgi:hypothetical protein